MSGVVSFVLLQLVCLSTIHNTAANVNAWVMVPQTATRAAVARPQTTSVVFMSADEETTEKETEADSSKEDEIEKLEQELKIAQLEAELRKLKEEKADEAPPQADETQPPKVKSGPMVVDDEEPVVSKEEDDKKVEYDEDGEILGEASMDMFLSEGWKEAKSGYDPKKTATVVRKTEEQESTVGLIAKVVGALVAVLLFSQIPVGQEDLSKYSSIKSVPVKTSIDLGDINRVKGQTQNGNDY
jgi:hypothetical protein